MVLASVLWCDAGVSWMKGCYVYFVWFLIFGNKSLLCDPAGLDHFGLQLEVIVSTLSAKTAEGTTTGPIHIESGVLLNRASCAD